jgi:hypothetical protein
MTSPAVPSSSTIPTFARPTTCRRRSTRGQVSESLGALSDLVGDVLESWHRA